MDNGYLARPKFRTLNAEAGPKLILGGALLSFVAGWVLYWNATGQPAYHGVIGCLAAVLALFLGYVYLPRLGRK